MRIAVIECVMDGMLFIVHRLNIMLIIIRVVKLVVGVMVAVIFSLIVSR